MNKIKSDNLTNLYKNKIGKYRVSAIKNQIVNMTNSKKSRKVKSKKKQQQIEVEDEEETQSKNSVINFENDEKEDEDDTIKHEEEEMDVAIPGEMNDSEKQIQICFVTKLKEKEYQIDNNTYTIPTSFKRIDLSRMLKQIMNIVDENVVFEFLIDHKILRSSIEEFLKENNILSEQVLEIEFTTPLKKKETKHLDNISEWISDLHILNNTLYASTFEGNLISYDLRRFRKMQQMEISHFPIHAFTISKNESRNFVDSFQSFYGLSNGLIHAFLCEQRESDTIIRSQVHLGNHEDIIKTISLNKENSIIVTGGYDRKINIYNNKLVLKTLDNLQDYEIEKNIENEKNKKKNVRNNKRKIEPTISPIKCIHNELDTITSINFLDATQFVCSGLGKHMNIYDVTNGTITSSFAYNQSIIHSSVLKKDVVVIADEHSVIKLFDIRCTENSNKMILGYQKKYLFHDKLITSLKCHKNELHFFSCSHDGFINIYDIRLNKYPVYSIENKEDSKILSGTWFYQGKNKNSLISANENKINIHYF